jgi:hypothetical protein
VIFVPICLKAHGSTSSCALAPNSIGCCQNSSLLAPTLPVNPNPKPLWIWIFSAPILPNPTGDHFVRAASRPNGHKARAERRATAKPDRRQAGREPHGRRSSLRSGGQVSIVQARQQSPHARGRRKAARRAGSTGLRGCPSINSSPVSRRTAIALTSVPPNFVPIRNAILKTAGANILNVGRRAVPNNSRNEPRANRRIEDRASSGCRRRSSRTFAATPVDAACADARRRS